MTCREAIAALAEYLEPSLGVEARGRLRAHLDDCAECRAYLATYRRTTRAVMASAAAAVPGGLRRRLRSVLYRELDG